MDMNTDNWKLELDRLLEIFERESTASLRKINRCFVASDCPFDEEFRKYFVDSSNRRLNTSFDTVLLERRLGDRMKMSLAVGASANDGQNGNTSNVACSANDRTQSPNVSENQNLCVVKVETAAANGVPIEIVDSDDENAVEEQQVQAANDSVEDQADANVLLTANLNDADSNDTNNDADVDMKREAKVEIESEMEDLPFVAFDPNENNDSFGAENGVAAAEFPNVPNVQSQPTPSNTQKQLKPANGQRFKCTDCKYSTRHKSHLTRHQRIHDPVKPFKCEHCEYAARRKAHLKAHQQIHEQQQLMGIGQDQMDGLFNCNLCDQQFTKWYALRQHFTRSHKRNQRLFNCAKCMRRFTQKDKKETHEARCENRRYECHLCKTYFTTKNSHMQRHLLTHSGAKPFECKICNRNFSTKSYLRSHLNSVHHHNKL